MQNWCSYVELEPEWYKPRISVVSGTYPSDCIG